MPLPLLSCKRSPQGPAHRPRCFLLVLGLQRSGPLMWPCIRGHPIYHLRHMPFDPTSLGPPGGQQTLPAFCPAAVAQASPEQRSLKHTCCSRGQWDGECRAASRTGRRSRRTRIPALPAAVGTRLDPAVRPSPRREKGQRLARWIRSLPTCLGVPASSSSRRDPSHKIPTLVLGLGVFRALSFTLCHWFLPS